MGTNDQGTTPNNHSVRNLLAMSLVFALILLARIGTAPLVPRFATDVLSTSVASAGIAVSVFGVASFLVDIPVGVLGDRIGRKPVILGGVALQALSGLLVWYSSDFLSFLISQIISGAGFAMNILGNWILLGDIAPANRRGAYGSLYVGLTQIGSFIGPALLGFAGQAYGLRSSFLLQTVLALSALAVGFVALVETKTRGPSRKGSLHGFLEVYRGKNMRNLVVAGALVWTSTQVLQSTVIPLYGRAIGLPVGQVGIALSLFQFAVMCATFTAGFISDRVGRKKVYIASILATVATSFSLFYASSFQTLSLFTGLFGLSSGFTTLTQIVLVTELSVQERRGVHTAAFRFTSDVAYSIGPIIAGLLFQVSDYSVTFALFSFLLLAATFWAWKIRVGSPRTLAEARSSPDDARTTGAENGRKSAADASNVAAQSVRDRRLFAGG